MTRTITTNDYEITIELIGSGFEIQSVKKGCRDITKDMDVTLRIRLNKEVYKILEDEREALELEAAQVEMDEPADGSEDAYRGDCWGNRDCDNAHNR